MGETEKLDAVIVGAGFSGIYLLHTLRRLGFSVKIHESGSDLGGVWHWNRYPGARVDSPSPVYELSLLEVWNDWTWTERYASAPKLREYFHYVSEKLDLSKDIVFNSHIIAADFDPSHDEWISRSSNGSVIRSHFLLLCTGIGSKPHIPNIEGLQSFSGPCYHSSRWPEDTILQGKRVGVIGTGASGVQIIQEIAPQVAHLTVFQRTPNFALRMPQSQLSAESQAHMKELYPVMFDRRKQTSWGFLWDVALNEDVVTTEEERLRFFEHLWEKGGFQFWLGSYFDMYHDKTVNDAAYSFWRTKVRARINDPFLQEKLAPSIAPHPFGVKRCSLEQTYFEVYNRSNVSLVDVNETSIEKIVPDGVVTSDGFLHELDVIALATGYDAAPAGITNIDIRGINGIRIREKWAAGVYTHLGYATAGFPNLFFVFGPQAPTAFCNGPTCGEIQGDWIANLLVHMRTKKFTRVETTRQAETEWRNFVRETAAKAIWNQSNSWFMGAGNASTLSEGLNFTGGLGIYRARCQECVEHGYEGFEFHPTTG